MSDPIATTDSKPSLTPRDKKPTVDLSGSEIEVEGPSAKNIRKPRPGSPAFDLQSPVTITAQYGSSQGGRRLSFGAMNVDINQDQPVESSVPSKRIRKPTFKITHGDAPVKTSRNKVVAPAAYKCSAETQSFPQVPTSGSAVSSGSLLADVAHPFPLPSGANVQCAGDMAGLANDIIDHKVLHQGTPQALVGERSYSEVVTGPRMKRDRIPLTIGGRSFSEEARMYSDDNDYPSLPVTDDQDSQLSDYSLRRRSSLKTKSVSHVASSRSSRRAAAEGLHSPSASHAVLSNSDDGAMVLKNEGDSSAGLTAASDFLARGPERYRPDASRHARSGRSLHCVRPPSPSHGASAIHSKTKEKVEARSRSSSRGHSNPRSPSPAPLHSKNKGKGKACSPSSDHSMGSLADFIVDDSDMESDSSPPRKSMPSVSKTKAKKRPRLSSDEEDLDHPKLGHTSRSKSSKKSSFRKKVKISSDCKDHSMCSDDGAVHNRDRRSRSSRKKRDRKRSRVSSDSDADISVIVITSSDSDAAHKSCLDGEDDDGDSSDASHSPKRRSASKSVPRKSLARKKEKKISCDFEESESDVSASNNSSDDSLPPRQASANRHRKNKSAKANAKDRKKVHDGIAGYSADTKRNAKHASSSQRRTLPTTPELDALHKRFPNLPPLLRFAELRPFRKLEEALQAAGQQNEILIKFAKIFRSMDSDDNARVLRRAQEFIQHGVFASPHNVGPEAFVLSNYYVIWKESRSNAVWLSSGVVRECNLITPARHGSSPGYLTKKITVYPFVENHDRTMSLFGSICNFDSVLGFFADGSLCFATKKDGAGSSSGAYLGITSPSPKKPNLFAQGSSRFAASARAKPRTHYPSVLNFNEDIPIYDARGSNFKFTPERLSTLTSLPLYHKGKKDLPPYSVVTVGYTFNVYTLNSEGLSSGFNIMFVILLGQADDANAH